MEPGEDAHPVRDGAGRWIERHIERGIFPRTNQPRVAQRELPRSSGRAVVPGDTDEGFADLWINDLDHRVKAHRLVGHRDERALDPPRATTRDANEKLGTVRTKRSARRRAAVRRPSIGARREGERQSE